MSNFFTKTDYNIECGIQDFKEIMDRVDVTELIEHDDSFYDVNSHPVISDPLSDETFDVKTTNSEFVVYKVDGQYHIYVERSQHDMTGWIWDEDNYKEKLGSVPKVYLNENCVPFNDFELIKKGKIKDIEENGEKVFDLIKENVIL